MGLQREIIDERESLSYRPSSATATGVGSMGILFLGAAVLSRSLPPDFGQSPGTLDQIILTHNYDNIIARVFATVQNTNRPFHNRRPLPNPTQFRHRELEWRRTHPETLHSLENEWVVLEGERIVAHGHDPIRVVDEARSKGISTPYIFFVEPQSDDIASIGL